MVNNSRFVAALWRLSTAGEASATLLKQLPRLVGLCRCCICRSACEKPRDLCAVCCRSVIIHRLNRAHCCACCALPLARETGGASVQFLCGQCQQYPPHFERCLAAVAYAPATGRLVNIVKHAGRLAALNPIAREMLLMLEQEPTGSVDILLPVPLHPRRLRERGFNQSQLLAKMLGKKLGIPVASRLAVRERYGRPQQNLGRHARLHNLRKAFALRRRVDGKRIAIVDDVVTSTATIESLAIQLLAAGALSVEAWCFARTPAPGAGPA